MEANERKGGEGGLQEKKKKKKKKKKRKKKKNPPPPPQKTKKGRRGGTLSKKEEEGKISVGPVPERAFFGDEKRYRKGGEKGKGIFEGGKGGKRKKRTSFAELPILYLIRLFIHRFRTASARGKEKRKKGQREKGGSSARVIFHPEDYCASAA